MPEKVIEGHVESLEFDVVQGDPVYRALVIMTEKVGPITTTSAEIRVLLSADDQDEVDAIREEALRRAQEFMAKAGQIVWA